MHGAHLIFLLKALGAVLILSAGILLGNRKAKEIENEAYELKNLETALLYLSSEISWVLSPLPLALEKAAKGSRGSVSQIFNAMASLVGLSEGLTAREALEKALGYGNSVPPTVKHILEDLTEGLGTSGHKEQLGYIDGFIQETRIQRKLHEEKAEKKGRLLRYQGALFALALIILLI